MSPSRPGDPAPAAPDDGQDDDGQVDDGQVDDGRAPRPQEPGLDVPRWLRVTSAWSWRLLAVALLIATVGFALAKLLVVALPLVVAIVLATLCIPAKEWLAARGVNPVLATAIVVVGGLGALVGLFAALAPQFAEQLTELGPTAVDGWEAFLDWLRDGPLGIDRAQLDDLISRAGDALSGGGSTDVVGGLVSGVSTVGQFLAGLALLVVLLFFIVKDAPQLVDWMTRRVPDRHNPTAAALGTRAWNALSGYVRGTATIALIDAVGIAIGLAVLGVPLVLPLTVLVFFGGFLPVIGALLAGMVAVLVALAAGGITKGLLVLALIVAVQQLEGNFLQPTIMRRAVSLHPLVVLTALAAGGAIAGIIGAFLSVPVAAVAAAVGNELRLRSEAGMLSADDDLTGEVPRTPLGGPGVPDPAD